MGEVLNVRFGHRVEWKYLVLDIGLHIGILSKYQESHVSDSKYKPTTILTGEYKNKS